VEHHTYGDRLGLRIHEAPAPDPLGAAKEFVGGALPAVECEPFVDPFFAERVEGPNP